MVNRLLGGRDWRGNNTLSRALEQQHIKLRCGYLDDRFHGHSGNACRQWCVQKKGTQVLGRSRGGFSTKLHMLCDTLGTVLAYWPSPGHCREVSHAAAVLKRVRLPSLPHSHTMPLLLGDKGYDNDGSSSLLSRSQHTCCYSLSADAASPSKRFSLSVRQTADQLQRHDDAGLYLSMCKTYFFVQFPAQLRGLD